MIRSKTRLAIAALGLVAIVAPALAAATPAYPATAAAPVPHAGTELQWRPCGDNVECATLQVPLDYARPRAATIGIALARIPAETTGRRLGTLMLMPGGPGGSGVQLIKELAQIPPGVLGGFDTVGFDPRGVGESAPISCLPDHRLDVYYAADITPDSRAEGRRLVDLYREFAAGCASRNPQLLGHVDTASVARDMDRIRIALGEHRLNFFGFSYGSHLGTTYAELFPDHFRTMALDGILDHSLAFDDLYVSSAGEFERVFGRFAAWCRQTADCPLAGRDAQQVYDQIVARAEQQPLPAPDATSPRPVHESDIHRVTLSRLGTPEQWPTLAAAIASAAAGDASLFRDLADLVTSRAPDGSYGPSHGIERGALACLDWPPVARNASDVAAIAARARRAAPRLGTAIVWDNIPQCISWPSPAVNPPHRLQIHGAPPILLVAGLHDPNDPYAWALSVASQIPSSVLLTSQRDGHVAYFRSPCVQTYVDRYLVTGVLGPKRFCP